MRSTAGILTLCFILSVNLSALTAHPVPPCKMIEILKLLEHEINGLNSSLKGNHVEYNAEIIHHLMINKSFPISKQNKSAACGLVYMEKALEQSRDHQSKRKKDEHLQKLFNDSIMRLKQNAIPCGHHFLVKCDRHPQPDFPKSDYKAKRWIRNFLDSSVKFLHQLIHLIEVSKNHHQ